MRSPNNELTAGQALALGIIQGPAELLPISSSAHTTAIAWLLGWGYSDLEPDLRKSFEVALHGGTALALLVSLRGDVLPARQSVLVLTAACALPAIAGYALEREIEGRLGTPGTIAAGLLAGSAAMVLADRAPQRRVWRDASFRDGVWLGLAQSIALIPGISRSGATLSAARLLGFRRTDAKRLSDEVGLPVLAGATLLKAIRLSRRGLERKWVLPFAVGTAGSLASSLVFVGSGRSGVRLRPFAIYRVALGTALLIRLMRGSKARRRGRALA